MKQKIPTVTIGIPAYNEEANIKNLLLSTLSQKEEGFTIKEIIVASDGSTDGTVRLVKRTDDPRITLLESKRRIGKSSHLNSLFRIATGDIIVLLDADVLLASTDSISRLISPFSEDTKVGLVGGSLVPSKDNSFMGKAVILTAKAYRDARIQWREGDNILSCEGGILALSKQFASSVKVPEDMIANDHFLYFSCITKGFKFKHVQTAKSWYRVPSTLKDWVRQSKRFSAAHYRLVRMFGRVALEEYAIPKPLLFKALFLQGIKKPVHTIVIFLINRYCGYLAKREETRMNAKWPIAITTKSGIEYEK